MEDSCTACRGVSLVVPVGEPGYRLLEFGNAGFARWMDHSDPGKLTLSCPTAFSILLASQEFSSLTEAGPVETAADLRYPRGNLLDILARTIVVGLLVNHLPVNGACRVEFC